MHCPSCGKQNGFIARFCQYCGLDLRDGLVFPQAWTEYAGFWRRLAAYAIDNAIVYIAAGLSLFALGLMFTPPAFGREWLFDHRIILGPVIPWLYWSIMESSEYQATIGKMVMGLKVTDSAGGRISFARATVRYWSKIISALLLMAGFLMIGFTRRKEGLHDIIAGSLVVRR